MTAPGIGARLKNARIGKGLAVDDISRDTRIAPRFIEAIESEDYSSLPGLIFTRSFIRQYALILNLDPNPLLEALPKVDENTTPLPDPPARPRARSLYRNERHMRALTTSAVWLLGIGVVGTAAYLYSNHYSLRLVAPPNHDVVKAASPAPDPAPAKAPVVIAGTKPSAPAVNDVENAAPAASAGSSAQVKISLTAHARAWIRIDADGKTAFMGTLTPNETKEISASEQIRLQTGNAGALTVSLNGKTLDSLGGLGQFRELRLTAEGPEFVQRDPQPPSDRL